MVRRRRRTPLAAGLALVVAAAFYATRPWPDAAVERAPSTVGEGAVERLHALRRSGVMADAAGRVARVLPDDRDGSRHQRFVLRLDGGHTVLVAHNIDLAPRVPLREGDPVRVRGQYEWNERGGVLHWTHHDPDGSHAEGFVEHGGRRYE